MARYCTKHSSVNIDEHNNRCPACENESKEPPPDFCMKHDNPVPLVDGSCIVCAETKDEPYGLSIEDKFNKLIDLIQGLVGTNEAILNRFEILEEKLINSIEDGPKRYESIGPP